MYDDKADLQLIEAVKKGDSRAFNILVMRYQTRVCKIVSRFVKDPHEMMDISQEIFIKAYKALDKFRADSSFYTWLYRIAINASKNYLVERGHRLPDVTFDIVDVEKYSGKNGRSENNTPEHIMMRNEIENLIYDAIDSLPEDLRKAILLREMDGLSYDEIAGVMGCPVGTVRSRIFRARAAIDKTVQPLIGGQ